MLPAILKSEILGKCRMEMGRGVGYMSYKGCMGYTRVNGGMGLMVNLGLAFLPACDKDEADS
jgi:hypothetical protein